MVAALGEQPRRHKTVAAVIARPGHDDDAAPGRKRGIDRIGDGLAGPLHESMPGTPPAMVRRSACAISALVRSSIMMS